MVDSNTAKPDLNSADAEQLKVAVPRVIDLLRHGDADFVQRAYGCVLGREADEGGLATYVGLLRDGVAKTDLLATLAQSSEAVLTRLRRAMAMCMGSHPSWRMRSDCPPFS